jgi:hypothetical protein
MRREFQIKFYANANEKAAIEAAAELNGISRGEFCRRSATGRPIRAGKPLYKAQQALERQRLQREAEEKEQAV